ncbi:papilin-like isoform x2, partial [Paramuricea clavata]
CTSDELKQFFSSFGFVTGSKIIKDNEGVSKGYGFISFERKSDAQKVLRMVIAFLQNLCVGLGLHRLGRFLRTQVWSFRTQVWSFRTQVWSFRTQVWSFRTQVWSFRTQVWSFRTQVWSFRTQVWSFRTQVWSFRTQVWSFRTQVWSFRTQAWSFRTQAWSFRTRAWSFRIEIWSLRIDHREKRLRIGPAIRRSNELGRHMKKESPEDTYLARNGVSLSLNNAIFSSAEYPAMTFDANSMPSPYPMTSTLNIGSPYCPKMFNYPSSCAVSGCTISQNAKECCAMENQGCAFIACSTPYIQM